MGSLKLVIATKSNIKMDILWEINAFLHNAFVSFMSFSKVDLIISREDAEDVQHCWLMSGVFDSKFGVALQIHACIAITKWMALYVSLLQKVGGEEGRLVLLHVHQRSFPLQI